MGSMAFPGMESNNAPLPIPGGYGNPTGVNSGGFQMKPSGGQSTPYGPTAFPSFPAFGPLQTPSAKASMAGSMTPGNFSPTGAGATPAFNAPVFGNTSLQGLQSGLIGGGMKNNGQSDALFKQLSDAYGPATASLLHNFLNNGSFNPQVAAAFLNAMQPGVQRGQADLLSAFGDAGSRFSSSASLGLGDYLSQVNLNEQQTLAGMYEQSQSQEQSLLSSLLPTLHAEEANKGGGIFSDILGGLEIAGGIAAAPFTGGLSLGLVGSGVGTLTGANGGGGAQAGRNSQGGLGALLQQLYKKMNPGQGGSVDMSGVSMGPTPSQSFPMEIPTDLLGISGGAALGGSDPFAGNI